MPDDNLGTVLITGGSSGLGAAIAAAVEQEGGTPVVLPYLEGRSTTQLMKEVARRDNH